RHPDVFRLLYVVLKDEICRHDSLSSRFKGHIQRHSAKIDAAWKRKIDRYEAIRQSPFFSFSNKVVKSGIDVALLIIFETASRKFKLLARWFLLHHGSWIRGVVKIEIVI